MTKYELVIWWSDEDSAFLVEVPELPVANVQEIVAQWIETAREEGREIPKPRGRLLFA